MVHGVFEPPSSFVLSAIGRNKLLVCGCAVVAALIGTAYGLSRPRTYTASATLQVGQVNPNSPGFYSYVQSASALATAFSRAISAEPVLADGPAQAQARTFCGRRAALRGADSREPGVSRDCHRPDEVRGHRACQRHRQRGGRL